MNSNFDSSDQQSQEHQFEVTTSKIQFDLAIRPRFRGLRSNKAKWSFKRIPGKTREIFEKRINRRGKE